jgi:transcriptional regulator with PAS, ATPase and Fis domain
MAENAWLRQDLDRSDGYGEATGPSGALKLLLAGITAFAALDTPLLLLGEPGTGKGVVARAIHRRSERRLQPMVTLDCAALPADLLEPELFGEAGRAGRWDLAGQGILFLDEIAELPVALQSRLLRTLRALPAAGRPGRAAARIIAATNRDLEQACAAGRFRTDLFDHLRRASLTVPPLRERREDIPALVETFVARFNRKLGRSVRGLSERCLAALMAHAWPGNVRELQNVIEQAMIVAPGPLLDLPKRFY